MGGGGGGGLSATNPVTRNEASADLSGALGQNLGPDGQWAAPQAQVPGSYGLAPQVDPVLNNPNAGVQTGSPAGGFAAPAIQQYFQGGGQQAQISYDAGQHEPWLGEVAADAETTAQAYVDASTPEDDSGAPVDVTGGAGTVQVGEDGEIIAYDNSFEQPLAENIQGIIEEGGVNPETGDYNIVSGPNVLSAADEGIFGYGSDYNQEFGENYDAQYEHSENNPTGQTTGTPLYDQGYVGLGVDPLGDAIGGYINDYSLPGVIGSAITGEPLLADVSSLLPPEESFSDYGSSSDDNDSGSSWQNDGDPTNDEGNAGWGFTSVADMFDGGGPGQSGDSYSGGVHGDSTTGDTSDGWSISDLWSGGNDDRGGSDDSGGSDSSSDDGTWCCTAAYKHGMPIKKIKELRKWHTQRSHIWQVGYDSYGHWIANNLVKGSTFWSRVVEAGHTAFVERRVTLMSSLAVLVIAPGSYAVGAYKLLRRKVHATV